MDRISAVRLPSTVGIDLSYELRGWYPARTERKNSFLREEMPGACEDRLVVGENSLTLGGVLIILASFQITIGPKTPFPNDP